MMASNETCTSTDLETSSIRNRPDLSLDIIAAVKGLHELGPHKLGKLIRDYGNTVVRLIDEDGSQIQVDLEKFAKHLPLHLIAVVMAWERDKSTFNYLLSGIMLLHSMCELASRVPKIEQILLDDVKVSEQQIDLVFYVLVLLSAYSQETHTIPSDMVILHSALVACSLKLLKVIVSSQYQEIAQVLTAYYKVDIFMEAAFTAVCIDVKSLQFKISDLLDDSRANSYPAAEDTLNCLCQQCDSSLEFLQFLCQQKLFRECVVKNKELCGNGGVLVLIQAIMNVKALGSHSTSSHVAAISRLKSKALSILLYLCETENVSYLDEVANNAASQDMAKSVALEVLDLLKKMFGIGSKQFNAPSEVVYPKGQLELNAMRLADVFSDDSNYRSCVMINFAEGLAEIFLLPHGEFLSGWCSSYLPVCEKDAPLDVPLTSYAHQRTSLLIKVIANLHCFVPDVCQDEKDLFLNKFIRFIQKEYQKPTDRFSSNLEADRISTVCKNLCSLLSHAESLVPQFLNEDDVQLLRLFINQVESQVVSAASEVHLAREAKNAGCSSPLHRESAQDLGSREVDRFDGSRNGDDRYFDENNSGMMEHDKSNGTFLNSLENEKDMRNVETSGSDSSPTRGQNNLTDPLDVDQETAEEERVEAIHSEEKQQRKRKRTIMNENQIGLIESAIVDEPDMHRNSLSLRLWADKLSLHGAEVTPSRLKNWLNNRKAKLARQAKEIRVSDDGDSLDRLGSSGHLDLPRNSMDDDGVSLAARGSIEYEPTNITITDTVDKDMGTSCSVPGDIVTPIMSIKERIYVMLINERGDEVGEGEVLRVAGHCFGMTLDKSGTCLVDIKQLYVDRFSMIPHPVEATGYSFDEAEKKLGSMRVLWDINKVVRCFKPGQDVILLGDKGQTIGKGTVYRVRGMCLEETLDLGKCIVEVKELSVDRFTDLPDPVKATDTSFNEAEKRLGLRRVVWDMNRLADK